VTPSPKGNDFYCIGAGGWANAKDLWLKQSTGLPIQKKGYVRKFLKVYEVVV
jgi:hypothetical protein